MADTGLHTRQQGQASYLGDATILETTVPQVVLALPNESGEVIRASFVNTTPLTGSTGNSRYVAVVRYHRVIPSVDADHMHYIWFNPDEPPPLGPFPAAAAWVPMTMKPAAASLRRFTPTHWVLAESEGVGTGGTGVLTQASVISYLVYGLFSLMEA